MTDLLINLLGLGGLEPGSFIRLMRTLLSRRGAGARDGRFIRVSSRGEREAREGVGGTVSFLGAFFFGGLDLLHCEN